MLVKTYGYAVHGINASLVTVEVSVDQGINFFLVGLPDTAVKESQQRISSSIKNSGFKMPGKQITINMAPADIRKEGAAYDASLAVGILAASEQIKSDILKDYIIMGELSLDGNINPIRGVLPIVLEAKKDNFKGCIIPIQNAKEAAIVDGIDIIGVETLTQIVKFLEGKIQITPTKININEEFYNKLNSYEFDFADVKGQENIKRAMEVAAAGGHNVIMIGPPGSGKSMLAKRIPTILPPLNINEALETTKIHSVAGKISKDTGLVTVRPFRSPHHTISDVALVGGGTNPQPGELSLAHNGVLFLDELTEFKRSVLDVMRQPLEERVVSISRSKYTVEYPASIMLVAAMNPCPCGYYNHPQKECTCSPSSVRRYLSKISGPLLDRIDIHIEVTPVDYNQLSDSRYGEKSNTIRERVIKARKIQEARFSNNSGIYCNAQMNTKLIRKYCYLDEKCNSLLKNAMTKLDLSARAYDRILKVARTIADLEQTENIQTHHIAEAIHYRSLDRQNWGK